MKILISGLGSIGLRHAKNFKKIGVDTLIGFDPSLSNRDAFNSQFNSLVVESFEEGLKYSPDLTVISSPNYYHMEQAITAAKYGCHLFIEKPLSHSTEGVEQLIKIIENKNLYVHIGSNWKFHPAFKMMKKIVDDGTLGIITGAQVLAGQWLPDWHPWEDYRQMYSAKKSLAGGIVLDSHEFDYLTWLLGPAKKLSGYCTQSDALEIETEDVAVACIHFERGTLATIHVDYIQRDYRRRYHLSGDKGTLEWDYTTNLITLYIADTKETKTIDVSLNDVNDMYIEQAKHIINGVKGNEEPVTSVYKAKSVLSLLLTVKGHYV